MGQTKGSKSEQCTKKEREVPHHKLLEASQWDCKWFREVQNKRWKKGGYCCLPKQLQGYKTMGDQTEKKQLPLQGVFALQLNAKVGEGSGRGDGGEV